MRFDIITIFPEMFTSWFSAGIIKKALEKKVIDIKVHDLRDYTTDKHRQVDDRPYGGLEGMVLKPEPIFRAVEEIRQAGASTLTCLLSPQASFLILFWQKSWPNMSSLSLSAVVMKELMKGLLNISLIKKSP
jgi:tRNA (Guanine37-N(1)-) methyltransferase (EC 2.1.1.31)